MNIYLDVAPEVPDPVVPPDVLQYLLTTSFVDLRPQVRINLVLLIEVLAHVKEPHDCVVDVTVSKGHSSKDKHYLLVDYDRIPSVVYVLLAFKHRIFVVELTALRRTDVLFQRQVPPRLEPPLLYKLRPSSHDCIYLFISGHIALLPAFSPQIGHSDLLTVEIVVGAHGVVIGRVKDCRMPRPRSRECGVVSALPVLLVAERIGRVQVLKLVVKQLPFCSYD